MIERGQVFVNWFYILTEFECQAYILKKKRAEDIPHSLQNIDPVFLELQITGEVTLHPAQKW